MNLGPLDQQESGHVPPTQNAEPGRMVEAAEPHKKATNRGHQQSQGTRSKPPHLEGNDTMTPTTKEGQSHNTTSTFTNSRGRGWDRTKTPPGGQEMSAGKATVHRGGRGSIRGRGNMRRPPRRN